MKQAGMGRWLPRELKVALCGALRPSCCRKTNTAVPDLRRQTPRKWLSHGEYGLIPEELTTDLTHPGCTFV